LPEIIKNFLKMLVFLLRNQESVKKGGKKKKKKKSKKIERRRGNAVKQAASHLVGLFGFWNRDSHSRRTGDVGELKINRGNHLRLFCRRIKDKARVLARVLTRVQWRVHKFLRQRKGGEKREEKRGKSLLLEYLFLSDV
jgi:hypothetical protein